MAGNSTNYLKEAYLCWFFRVLIASWKHRRLKDRTKKSPTIFVQFLIICGSWKLVSIKFVYSFRKCLFCSKVYYNIILRTCAIRYLVTALLIYKKCLRSQIIIFSQTKKWLPFYHFGFFLNSLPEIMIPTKVRRKQWFFASSSRDIH